jgi:hypothetical protein
MAEQVLLDRQEEMAEPGLLDQVAGTVKLVQLVKKVQQARRELLALVVLMEEPVLLEWQEQLDLLVLLEQLV